MVRLDKLQTPVSRSNCQLVHYLVLVFLTENKVQSAVSVINLMAYCVFVVLATCIQRAFLGVV